MNKIYYTDEARKIINELHLNIRLLQENQVPNENILQMPKYYKKLKNLFNEAHKLYNEYSGQIPKDETEIGKQVDEVESKLQELWNFEKNEAYYRYWIELPGCTCPKMDNEDMYVVHRIINCSCPYHNYLCKK